MERKTSIREILRAKGYFDNKLVIIPRHQQLTEGIAMKSDHQRITAKSDQLWPWRFGIILISTVETSWPMAFVT